MTYPCGIIRDLLPLYIDDVCNEESKQAVENHLSECEKCRNYYEAMKSTDGFVAKENDNSEDMKMAKRLKNVKNTILIKRIIASLISVIVVIGIIFGTVAILKTTECEIVYDDNITIIDTIPEQYKSLQGKDYLSAQFVGHNAVWATQKRVEIPKGDDTEIRIYFYAVTTKWEDLISDDKTMSYHILAPINEDNDIDKIFYYVGDYTDLEKKSESELAEIDKQSTLLWSK